jgi:NAD-dependent SIR2 family protein deacetylase
VVTVRCTHCGARYDTDLPVRAIERVRRCSRCGHVGLVSAGEGADPPAPANPEPEEHGPAA